MFDKDKRPKVGIGVIIVKDNKVLLGKRKGSNGAGGWSFPGGHLEYAEGVEECARRELLEEAGIEVGELIVGPYTNDFFEDEEKHYITLYVIARYGSGEPKICEPDKCDGWDWYDWDNLPENLFPPVARLKATDFKPSDFLPS
jgi:8-oxo-dGTP diphosphatase